MSAFELLAKPIQHVLWDMQWRELRPIQVDAIKTVLTSDDDLLISARTASGKTEAAFLPVLSRLFETPGESVGAMYIGPLKALINDQFRRLETLCDRAEIPVHRWHGDVDGGKKAKLLKDPRGVILITPESLESFFVNRSSSLARVFGQLRFVVIDEIHSMVGRERGLQLRSQLHRLRRYTRDDFRLLGLSATIGDAVPLYQEWMRPDSPDRVHHIFDPGEEKNVQFSIQVFATNQRATPVELAGATSLPNEIDADIPAEMTTDAMKHFAGRKNLIFCNNRGVVEWFADSLNDECRKLGRPEEFLVHHGSVSKDLRQHAEESMRADRPATIVCSSTMELGIDIGSVAQVGQVGACWSVNSFVQRLGRSGRRDGEPQRMRVLLPLREHAADSDLVERLYPELLQAIALMELAKQRWVEPPRLTESDFSTLTHQIFSVLAEHGGLKAGPLFARLVTTGAFRGVEQSTFASILRCLGSEGWIEQMEDGTLLLSPKAERLVHDLDFYSVFVSAHELTVRHDGREIGSLSAMYVPMQGDHFLLAGRRWETLEVDQSVGEIRVRPALGRKPPKFFGSGGEIHPRIREEMKRIATSNAVYPYLNTTARRFLESARQSHRNVVATPSSFVDVGEGRCLFFTWTGTRIQRTLMFLAERVGLQGIDLKIAIQFKAEPEQVIAVLNHELDKLNSAESVSDATVTPWRKFDDYLSNEILLSPFLEEFLDVPGTMSLLAQATTSFAQSQLDAAFADWTTSAAKTTCGVHRYDSTTLAPDASLHDCTFVAFDIETTGFSPSNSRIIEIGAVRFQLGQVQTREFQALVNPESNIPYAATRVHGITNDMVRGQRRIEQVLPSFYQFAFKDPPVILVAHNASFDREFLASELSRCGMDFPLLPIADTLSLARHAFPGLANHRLPTLVEHFRLENVSFHRALADAIHTRHIFERLTQHLSLRAFADLALCCELKAQ